MEPARRRIAVTDDRKTRVLIVDDHPIIREGLARLINQELDMMVAGSAKDRESALAALSSLEVDVLVLDLSLPDVVGFQLIEEIRRLHPALPILILSMHGEPHNAERALKAGATGYITKAEAPEAVLTAIRTILQQQIYVSEELAAKILGQMASGDTRSPVASLSNRELQVLRLIGDGISTRRIAANLDLSIKTVETYRGNIKRKLGLRDSAELVNYAVRFVLSEGSGEP